MPQAMVGIRAQARILAARADSQHSMSGSWSSKLVSTRLIAFGSNASMADGIRPPADASVMIRIPPHDPDDACDPGDASVMIRVPRLP